MNNKKAAIGFVAASYLWLAAGVLIASAFYPNYSHISQFMSELGAAGAPHGPWMNYVGFLGTEVLFGIGMVFAALLLPKSARNLIVFAIFLGYPILIAVAAFYPCDFECRPDEPTFSHAVHIATGLIAYVCAVVGLGVLSQQKGANPPNQTLQKASWLLLRMLGLSIALLTAENAYAGALQRLLETTIYGWTIWWIWSLEGQSPNQSA